MNDNCKICGFPLSEMIHEERLCKLRAAKVAEFYGVDPGQVDGDCTTVSINWDLLDEMDSWTVCPRALSSEEIAEKWSKDDDTQGS